MRTLILVLLVAACGGPEASMDLLVGVREIDFDASWDLSRDSFMNNPSLDPAAPKDEKKARATTRELLKGYTLAFTRDGKCTETLPIGSREGTFKVLSKDGSLMRIEAVLDGQKRTLDVEFKSSDKILQTLVGRVRYAFVLTRRLSGTESPGR